MPFSKLKDWSYHRALRQLLTVKQTAKSHKIQLNPAKTFLIFFDGRDEKNRQFIQTKSSQLQNKGIKTKLLAFTKTNGDLQNLGITLYDESNIRWNHVPKANLIELVRFQEFDVLININPAELKHLHYLAVAANARFKLSNFTKLPGNFKLVVKTKPDSSVIQCYEQLDYFLKTLSV